MNISRLKWTVVLLAALAAMPACAERGHRGAREGREALVPMQPYYDRSGQARDEEAWRARMSAEERRQLRRDIHDAGRELYRPHGLRPLRADGTVPAESR